MRAALAATAGVAVWLASTVPHAASASLLAPPSGAVAASAAVASTESTAIVYRAGAGTTRSFPLRGSSPSYVRPRIAFTSDRLVVSQVAGFAQGRTSWMVRTIRLT